MSKRNTEHNFAQIPPLDVPRSSFNRSHTFKSTFDAGRLIPFYIDEVYPADTFKLRANLFARMSTPLFPVMDNAYLDTFFFFVPYRLLWQHWENLMGQNDSSYWAEKTEYSVPQTTAPSGGWNVGTIADYMGIPTQVANLKVNSMPFRAYARIWNEWFRDENLQQPVVQDIDDANNTGSNTGDQLTDAQNGGLPLKVAKYHDYFTSCLPEPQKGEAAAIPIKLGGFAPVYWGDQNGQPYESEGNTPGYFLKNGSMDSTVYQTFASTYKPGKTPPWDSPDTGNYSKTGFPVYYDQGNHGQAGQNNIGGWLVADMTAGNQVSITVNELRQAIAIQHILEADARGGTRYTELLAHEFGVTSPDSRLQRSEYLGGTRVPININQVIQQSATTDASPQGNTAAYSMTTLRNKMCNYSAVEHGYLIILGAIRVDHSYQQGLSRMWTRKGRFDFYHPMLANLSEMAVLNKEIYAQGTAEDDEVFGYQEAWADYRYHPNIVTGEMRSTYAQTLDAWHYGDHYDKLPTLSSTWIQEGTENIDRTLAVQSENSHKFICDFFFDQTWTRPMPIYSIPGLNTI